MWASGEYGLDQWYSFCDQKSLEDPQEGGPGAPGDDSMTAVEEEEDGRDRVSSRSYGEVDLGDQRTDYMQGGLFLLLLTWSLLSFMSEPCKS